MEEGRIMMRASRRDGWYERLMKQVPTTTTLHALYCRLFAQKFAFTVVFKFPQMQDTSSTTTRTGSEWLP